MNKSPSTSETLQELQQQNELMRSLGTREGFFKIYFKELGKQKNGHPMHRTNCECFNYVNRLHFDLFGEERFSGYHSFINAYKHYLTTK